VKVCRQAEHLELHLSRRELRLFRDLLSIYPCVPRAHARLTHQATLPEADANQQLLEEALAAQRAIVRRHLALMFEDPAKFCQLEKSARLRLSDGEVEFLLQALNDIRVGNWIQMGSPDTLPDPFEADDRQAPHGWAMEAAGFFQSQILNGLEGGETPEPSPHETPPET
jgi:hypothetical protein